MLRVSKYACSLLMLLTSVTLYSFLVGIMSKRYESVIDGVLVPGFGFSYFWYSFGRLERFPSDHIENRDFFCYSSGCLALTAVKRKMAVDDLFIYCIGLQQQWQQNTLSRPEALSSFIGYLLSADSTNEVCDLNDERNCHTEEWFNNINVITTTQYGQVTVKKPSNVAEFRELLLKTAHIPYITGDGLHRDGELDGAFSMLLHPFFSHHVGFEWTLDMILNALNINMDYATARSLYDRGRS
jgi:hypothetical protein